MPWAAETVPAPPAGNGARHKKSREARPHPMEKEPGPLARRRSAGSDGSARLRWVLTSGDAGWRVMATTFVTAIEAWDKRWATAEGRADWLDPEADVMA